MLALHGIGHGLALGTRQNSEKCIAAGHSLARGEAAGFGARGGDRQYVWKEGVALRDRLPRSLGRVAEWQTRWLQVPVSFGTWGFKSPFAHNSCEDKSPISRWRVFNCA